jgi:hypothetical protein
MLVGLSLFLDQVEHFFHFPFLLRVSVFLVLVFCLKFLKNVPSSSVTVVLVLIGSHHFLFLTGLLFLKKPFPDNFLVMGVEENIWTEER